jgi:ubiquinone/menaquinone biosynthesis C-methylase UbiE
VSWERFERAAPHYEDWYATRRGKRASRAERQLLAFLLADFPHARSALEVGCGTGHFTGWLAQRGLRAIGLDRSGAMLAVLRRRHPGCPAIRADAHALPIADGAVDLVVFVTTLEFLGEPRRALAEAARAAKQGVIAVALNRLSLGAVSRRIGPASRGALLSAAHDFTASRLRALLEEAAATRLLGARSRSALLPPPLPAAPTRIPFGDAVGVAVALRSEGGAARRASEV